MKIPKIIKRWLEIMDEEVPSDPGPQPSSHNIFKVPVQACPMCKAPLDGAIKTIGDGNHPPRQGDISMCIHCGSLLEFASNGALIFMSSTTWDSLPTDVRHALYSAASFVQARGKQRKESDYGWLGD